MEYTPGREYGTAIPHTPYSAPTGIGGLVTFANLLFAVVIIVALIINQTSAVTAIIVGGLYYGVTTHSALLILSGTLTDILRTHSDARTQRELNRLTYTVHKPHADLLPEPRRPATLVAPSYVAPVDDGIRREAMAWLVQLYDERGQPDSRKVLLSTAKERPGRIRIKAPSDQATEYLVQRGVLRVRVKGGQRNGYALNMRYSLRDDALQVL